MALELELVVATCHQPEWQRCTETWAARAASPVPLTVIEHKELMEAYQLGFERTNADIIGFVHDDVLVEEDNWDIWVRQEFEDSAVGLLGFAGAPGHGHPHMYRIPYDPGQLARSGFCSNMRNAEVHGARYTLSRDVAVLDGFTLFVRRAVLERAGGWPRGTPVGYFGYDYWISCETRRQGYRIRMIGVACDHIGGNSTNLGPVPLGGKDFDDAHRYIYDTCRDVLPYEVPPCSRS